jgi:hypothetical protein
MVKLKMPKYDSPVRPVHGVIALPACVWTLFNPPRSALVGDAEIAGSSSRQPVCHQLMSDD